LALFILFGVADAILLPVIVFTFLSPTAQASRPPTLAPTLTPSVVVAQVPADVASPTPVVALPTPIRATYTVVDGDTLTSIALRFNLSLDAVIAANPGINPDLLHPGDVLAIPPTLVVVPTGTPEPVSPTPVAVIQPTDTPTPLLGLEATMARVSADGDGLRLRQSPGTAGVVMDYLPALLPLTVIGRTQDSQWMHVVTPTGAIGWVMTQWVDVYISLPDMPVTGVAVDATETPIPPTSTRTSATGAAPTAGSSPTATTQAPSAPTSTATHTQPPPPPTLGQPPPGPPSVYAHISGITERSHQIFLYGQTLGNRADVFSKVGDSITVAAPFLIPIGSGQYNLQAHAYLQPALDYFARTTAWDGNSYVNTSQAAKGGWSAWTVINPYVVNSNCFTYEMPLVCEYRLARPSIALIMLGTNDVKTTPADTYERYLRTTIETSINMGVIPVLSTIPDLHRDWAVGRVEIINGIIVRLAREYDVPLWDYWSALQALPNDGLSGDGVHPSYPSIAGAANFTPDNLQYGYTVRNLLALQALDAVWRGALHQ
jgi:LysM repeat protein